MELEELRDLEGVLANRSYRIGTSVSKDGWARLLGVGVVWVVSMTMAGCSDGATEAGWDLGQGAGDVVEGARADGLDDDRDEEVVCGEPSQVIETMDEAAQLDENCDVYRGSFDFERRAFSDLSELPELRVIEGELAISRIDGLRSMHGLERLERLGSMVFGVQQPIEDFSALANLRRIDGILMLHLTSFRELFDLPSLRFAGELDISGNIELRNLEGLVALERVREFVVIEGNSMISVEEARAFVEDIEVGGEIRLE